MLVNKFMLNNLSPLLVFLLFGFIPLICGLWRILQELRPKHWLKVSGIVVDSTIIKRPTSIHYVKFFAYFPNIEYEYNYNEKKYKSKRVSFSGYVSGRKQDAFLTASRYSVASHVVVFVNPSSPSDSVLEYGVTMGNWILVIVGIIIAAIGIALAPFIK